jgi:transposase
MRRIREVLRLQHLGLPGRQIARSLQIGQATVVEYLQRAKRAGLAWPLPDDLDDDAIEKALFFIPKEDEQSVRPTPDWNRIHQELRRKHVTLLLLWDEYLTQNPNGYHYSRFCDHYRRWAGTLSLWMRQEHHGGDKLFVDFSGDGIPWVNPLTGEEHEAQLFVAALGASSYTYAVAFPSQELPYWIEGHVRTYEFIGGVTRLTVPDQPRTAVSRSCRYDPALNPSYQEMADHYRTCVVPARPRKPRDKAKVEAAVLIAQRWIIAVLRHRLFSSIAEINRAIPELLEKINRRPMRRLKRSRWDLFLELDRPKLLALPEKAYQYSLWKIGLRVGPDYHVEFEKHYYSVPYQLVRQQVDLRVSGNTLEVFHHHKRIASHLFASSGPRHHTLTDHMPRSHQAHAEWTPERIINWARETGTSTAQLIDKILAERPHPEQGYRACLGILRLAKRYSPQRLEKACARGLVTGGHSYHSIDSMLKNRLEDQPLPPRSTTALPLHENLRGSGYYH